MGDTIEALIPKTQELLQPLIAKPKLADKLLMKPPFRFLHDIFTALTQSSGFAKGLYNDFELDSANMKEKNQKITYLDKMVVCVGQCLGKEIDVRSAKIVAGLEAENTNMFLQALAQAVSAQSSDKWASAVQKTLAKIPSLTPDGGSALPTATPAPAAEAKPVAAAERPASKERPSSPEAEKAAAAEAKAKEKARKEKEEADRKDKELKAEAAAKKKEVEEAKATKAGEAKAGEVSSADPKSGSNSRSSSSSSSRGAKSAPPDNNKEMDDSTAQQINECNGDVERTKDVIEKIIQKPKMVAKLLSKPPFRFIHDIVSEITRVTGFAEGLYNAEELDSAAIKEKGPKIDYLNKIILCVSCQLNVEIEAKPAKIVAGLEPDDTNKFLQLLGIACRSGSSAEAVQRVLSGDTAVRASGAAKKASSGGNSGSSSSKGAEREATPETKLSSRSTTPLETKGRPSAKEGKEPSAAPSAGAGTFGGPMKPLALKNEDEENEENTNLRFNSESKDSGEDHQTAPGTSGLGTSRTSRPTTARRRPPKLKENVTEVGRLMVHDTKVAPVVGIMKDGDNGDSDDDVNADDSNPSGGGSNNNSSLLHDEGGGGAHGKLVRDILKDQSAEEAARNQKEDEDAAGGGANNEAETGIRLGRRKKSFKDKSKSGASNTAEMNELRNNIQKICQATNPVGKGVEFVHEDLDAMSKELEQWKKEYEKKRELYEEERKKTDEALQPLQVQLLEVDELIKEQVRKINSLKATIAKNEEKTQKLLHMVVSA